MSTTKCVPGRDASGGAGVYAQDVRLSAAQRRVYGLLAEDGGPLSAYELLDRLARAGNGAPRRVYPQTVYRALARLCERGLVHRVESLNAYLPCRTPARKHRGIHLLCDRCGRAEELVDVDISAALDAAAEARGFQPQHQIIEVHGICAACRSARAAP
ncbi:MAG TPA: transcriptional repressor [Nevskiaceae bacterium]